jgi:hypothetical protein
MSDSPAKDTVAATVSCPWPKQAAAGRFGPAKDTVAIAGSVLRTAARVGVRQSPGPVGSAFSRWLTISEETPP